MLLPPSMYLCLPFTSPRHPLTKVYSDTQEFESVYHVTSTFAFQLRTLTLQLLQLGVTSSQRDSCKEISAEVSGSLCSFLGFCSGFAVLEACKKILEGLGPYLSQCRTPQPTTDEERISTLAKAATLAHFDRVNLSANGFYATPDIS